MLARLALLLALATPVLAQHVRTVPLDRPLGTPDGMAVGPDGALYVADFGGGSGTRVLRVDRDGRVTTFADGFAAPDGLAFDARGDLFVASFNGGTVHRVRSGGAIEAFASGLDHPSSMAFDAEGRLYVACFGNFDGTVLVRIAPGAAIDTVARGFRTPLGVAIGPDARVYVGSYATGEIHRVGVDGTLERFASVPRAPLPQLQYLAFDRRGTLYAASLGHDRIYAIDATGRVTTLAGSGVAGHRDGPRATARFHGPNSVGIRGDTLFVTEFRSGRLRAIPLGGARQEDAPSARLVPALVPRRLADDSATFVVTQETHGGGTDSLGVVHVVRRGDGDALRLVQHWETRPLQSRDTLVLDRVTLRPRARIAGPAARRTETRYTPALVAVTRTPARAETLSVATGDLRAFEGASLELLAAALPDRLGDDAALPLFVAAQRGVVWAEVRSRRVPGTAARDVEIAYPSTLVTVRIAADGRRVLRASYDYGTRSLVFTRR